MATIIRVTGADFSANAVGFVPPVASGLAGWWLLGGSQSASVRNLAPGGSDAGVGGTPSYGAGYVSFDGVAGNYFTTSIAETADMTLIVAARSLDTFATTTDRPQIIGTYQFGAVPHGITLAATAVGTGGLPAASLTNWASYDNGTGTSMGHNVPGFDNFKALAAVVESGVGRRTHDLTAGTSTTAATALTRVGAGISTRTVRIGMGAGLGSRGISDVAFAAVYTRALSAGELTTIYDFIQPILAGRGVTV
jgi:hypothetical protein